jgi:pSer/pThr/pTyr-binding forkhead associated (FHA) protein
MPKLKILNGQLKGEEVVLTKTDYSVGQRQGADISVPDPWISWNHARFFRKNGNYWIEDVGSTNGTYVNCVKVSREALTHEDVIFLGKTHLLFLDPKGAKAQRKPTEIEQELLSAREEPEAEEADLEEEREETVHIGEEHEYHFDEVLLDSDLAPEELEITFSEPLYPEEEGKQEDEAEVEGLVAEGIGEADLLTEDDLIPLEDWEEKAAVQKTSGLIGDLDLGDKAVKPREKDSERAEIIEGGLLEKEEEEKEEAKPVAAIAPARKAPMITPAKRPKVSERAEEEGLISYEMLQKMEQMEVKLKRQEAKITALREERNELRKLVRHKTKTGGLEKAAGSEALEKLTVDLAQAKQKIVSLEKVNGELRGLLSEREKELDELTPGVLEKEDYIEELREVIALQKKQIEEFRRKLGER